MPTSMPFDENNWLPVVDAVIAKWKECTAPIFVENLSPAGTPTGDAQLLGTGFIATYRKMSFLVTAAHVLKGLDTKRLLATNLKDKAILLSGLPFLFCHDNDLAIAPLEQEWLVATGLPSLNTIDLDDICENYEPIGCWITVGYPGSKNGIYPRLGKHAINSHGTSFTEMIQKPTAKAHIGNPLGFRFDKKSAVDTDNKRANPPSFSGTSGSPILEVLARVTPAGNISLRCMLQGVLLGWHKKEKEVIAGRVEALEALMEELFEMLESAKAKAVTQ